MTPLSGSEEDAEFIRRTRFVLDRCVLWEGRYIRQYPTQMTRSPSYDNLSTFIAKEMNT